MKQLTTLLLAILLTASAWGQECNLFTDYGIQFLNGSNSLTQQYGTTTAAQAKFPHLFGWARAKGWTDAEIMSLAHMEAAWHDCFWRGEAGNYNSPNPGHAWNITVPAGRFRITYPLIFAQGKYQGAGSRFSDGTGNHTYGSTELRVDHAAWKANRSADRIIMRSANWGVDGGYGAWVHHYTITAFMFNGARRSNWITPNSPESAGIGAWDSGEASHISDCYFDQWEKDGILCVRGTPIYIESCSAFNVNRFGFALVGGGSVTYTAISGDESGIALVGGIEGYGRPGAGRIVVHGAKQETSTGGEFRPWKGSSFMRLEGWYNVSIAGVSYASSWTTPYDFISWKKGPGNFSSISVTGTHYFGNAPRCIFYDETRNLEYLFEGNAWQNHVQSWVWDEQHGLKTPWKTITPNVRGGTAGRLQHVGPDGATSWATAGIYDPTGGTVAPPPQPTPCTYTYSAWSACNNGTQTRTVVSSTPAGCTGTPVLSQPCTIVVEPPPPSSTFNFTTATWNPAPGSVTASRITNSNGSAKGVVNITARTFTFTITPTSLSYVLVLNKGGRGIILLPNGSIVDNTTPNNDVVLLPAGTLALNVKKTVTVTLPVVRTFDRIGAGDGAGNCFKGTLETLSFQ
jgi:hypothetical protein